MSVIPIYDGFVLRKGENQSRYNSFPVRRSLTRHSTLIAIQKQAVGGSLISEVLLHQLQSQNIPVTPRYLVKTKEAVGPDQPSNASLR